MSFLIAPLFAMVDDAGVRHDVIVVWKDKMPFCVLKMNKERKMSYEMSIETCPITFCQYYRLGDDVLCINKLDDENKAAVFSAIDDDANFSAVGKKPSAVILRHLADISKKTGK